jgi:hypothetical protein
MAKSPGCRQQQTLYQGLEMLTSRFILRKLHLQRFKQQIIIGGQHVIKLRKSTALFTHYRGF